MHSSHFYKIIWVIRRLFQQFASIADDMNSKINITAGKRAILEFLDQKDQQTVPQIANEKSVTRQHIQSFVNELLKDGHVETVENPIHKRSPLIKMTTSGQELFNQIKKNEAQLIKKMEKAFDAKSLEITAHTLQQMYQYLNTDEFNQVFSKMLKT